MNDPYITYAQNREDLLLNAFFEPSEKGFYVDVGANHPVHESVTKLFYDKGWRGMNLEPTNRLYELLCLTRPRDINVQVGVSDHSGSLNFREYPHGDGLSTFAEKIQKDYERTGNVFTQGYKEYKVPVKTLAELFKQYEVKQIDFMKVDIEGYEYEALAGNNWKQWRPKVLCIEANHIVRDWHDLIAAAGYTLAYFDGLNEYFVSKEEHVRAERFSYPDRVLLGPRSIGWTEYKARQDLQREISVLKYDLDKARECQQLPASGDDGYVLRHVKRRLRRIDTAIETRLAKPTHITSFPPLKGDIYSPAEFVAALTGQLHSTSGLTVGPRPSQKRYRSLKRRSKAVIRRARR